MISLLKVKIIIPLLIGGIIYILFRERTIIICEIADYFGFYNLISINPQKCHKNLLIQIGIYSLPDGLWMYSMTYTLHRQSQFFNGMTRWILTLLGLIIAVFSEFLQLIKVVPGTFDIFDILMYCGFAGFAILKEGVIICFVKTVAKRFERKRKSVMDVAINL